MWRELDAALSEGRPKEALRLAAELWRDARDASLADLVDALAAFVDSDPRTAPLEPPDDPADLGGWLTRVDEASRRIFDGEWWTRDTKTDLFALLVEYGKLDDPRVATAVANFLFDDHVFRNIDDASPFVERLVTLRDARVYPRIRELAGSFEPATSATRQGMIRAAAKLFPAVPLAPAEAAVVARGLARYRDEADRLVERLHDFDHETDDGTEQVVSDALSEMGHPYGEAIALEYDAAAGIITAAGRERLATLIACHEERWIGRDLYLATKDRTYRGGLLDAFTLKLRPGTALLDRRLLRVRVVRADSDLWDEQEARSLRESPWLERVEELDAPSFEFLAAACRSRYPHLQRLRLGRLRPVRQSDPWNHWAQPLAAWRPFLPALREVVFRTIPEDGLEVLIEALRSERLDETIPTWSLDGTRWSWVRQGERDPTMWFRLLDPHPTIRRAALYYSDATLTVEWQAGPDRALDITLETSDGGAAFDLLQRLPPRPIASLVFREFPGRRPKKLTGLGRLRRFLGTLPSTATIDMPTRWKNQIEDLPDD